MKNLILSVLTFLFFIGCGGIKNSVEQGIFTDSEKALFNTAVEKYKTTDISHDVTITSFTSDTLLVITGVWHSTPPNPFYDYDDKYEYKFTKENEKFIVREYKNDEFVTEKNNDSFNILLEQVLYIDLE